MNRPSLASGCRLKALPALEQALIKAVRDYYHSRTPEQDWFLPLLDRATAQATALAVRDVVEVLLRGYRRVPEIRMLTNRRLSADETTFLRGFRACQHEDRDTTGAVAEWLIVKSLAPAFATNMALLAQKLSATVSTPAVSSTVAIEAPGVIKSSQLNSGESQILTAFRTWVSCFKRGDDPLPVVTQQFMRQGLGQAAATGLDAALNVVAITARRSIDVRCVACAGISPDEARFLAAVTALQQAISAEPILTELLEPAGVRLVLSPLSSFADMLTSQHLVLPQRAWDYAALEALAAPSDVLDFKSVAEAPILH